jgi:hypothetical protein
MPDPAYRTSVLAERRAKELISRRMIAARAGITSDVMTLLNDEMWVTDDEGYTVAGFNMDDVMDVLVDSVTVTNMDDRLVVSVETDKLQSFMSFGENEERIQKFKQAVTDIVIKHLKD